MRDKRILQMAAGLLLAVVVAAQATVYYVAKSGDNTTGTTWATAFNECNRIKWSSMLTSDTVCFDGGADSAVYTTPLRISKGGTYANRLLVTRSTATGHAGKVVVTGTVYTEFPYVTIDGLDKYKFVFSPVITFSTYLVRVNPTADYFQFKNVSLMSEFSTVSDFGTPLFADNGHLLIKGCWFYGTNYEDQIKYNGAGTVIIENSYFSGLVTHGSIHEDIVQFDVPSVDSFVVRRSIFTNGGTDCFMLASTTVNTMVSEYCVFSQVADGIKYQGGTRLTVTNTVFDRCRDILLYTSVPTVNIKNCIFNGISWSGPVHVSGSPQYSLWDAGTTNWSAGTGNQQAGPLFLNEDSPAGADGIPFTVDDGFRLKTGSPAINAGTSNGFTSDIMGTALNGTPDMGAYEYSTTGISNGERQTTNDERENGNKESVYHNLLHNTESQGIYTLTGEKIKAGNTTPVGIYFIKNNDRLQKTIVVE